MIKFQKKKIIISVGFSGNDRSIIEKVKDMLKYDGILILEENKMVKENLKWLNKEMKGKIIKWKLEIV